ncbi:hypothetical protein [Paenibacillus sp. V4I7]|uniref:hypothetical protein n=1 Tax=Paenibacillus sp. V4I7 TaxID=3042307 RepID=UPI00278AF2C5|nr:hypothetical protein [Paenibacillus sp. V4I7]MDQ0897548.1 hypothetical protein [Paenibacillus sp. V4I7]
MLKYKSGRDGDYTLCYFDKRLKVTHAHMLARGVIVYSPIQMMFWYDKPSDWKGEQEIEFWEKLPVSPPILNICYN